MMGTQAGLKTGSHVLLVVLGAVLALAGLSVRAQGNPEAAKLQNPTAPSAESVGAGQQLYRRYCASCHGANAEGGAGNDLIPAAPDLTDKEWKHGSSDGEIFVRLRHRNTKHRVPSTFHQKPHA